MVKRVRGDNDDGCCCRRFNPLSSGLFRCCCVIGGDDDVCMLDGDSDGGDVGGSESDIRLRAALTPHGKCGFFRTVACGGIGGDASPLRFILLLLLLLFCHRCRHRCSLRCQ